MDNMNENGRMADAMALEFTLLLLELDMSVRSNWNLKYLPNYTLSNFVNYYFNFK